VVVSNNNEWALTMLPCRIPAPRGHPLVGLKYAANGVRFEDSPLLGYFGRVGMELK
jgi:hypothetical protein